MRNTSNILIAAFAVGAFAASAPAQRLATYDPASPRELASSACPPAAAFMRTRNLAARTPGFLASLGAIAADNVHRVLYTTTGRVADGIDAVSFSNIGTSGGTITYPAPPGMNQITGMVVDPIYPDGGIVIVTDGFSLGPYDLALGTFPVPLSPIPLPAGTTATGLDVDVWNHDLVVVLNNATILRVPLGGGPWTTQPATFSAPSTATGVAICRHMPSQPMVSFFDGTVMDPATGATRPFPSGFLGPRRHRGMTFYARPIFLGGKGNVSPPQVDLIGSYQAGSNDCRVQIESSRINVLAVDLSASMTGTPGLPMIDGILVGNPAQSVNLLFAPGQNELPLNLTNVPHGVGATAQAAGLGNGVFHMSEALFFQTWR